MISGRGFARGRRRLWLAVLTLVVVAGVGVLSAGALRGAFSYYKTPTELEGTAVSSTQSVRLEGMVAPGSVHHRGDVVRFVLTDGATDVHVVSRGTPPGTFRSGQGAVVLGHYVHGNYFRASQVTVRHSNRYYPAGSSGARG